MVQNEVKIGKTISAFKKYASYQQKLFLQTKNDKGNAATRFFFFFLMWHMIHQRQPIHAKKKV